MQGFYGYPDPITVRLPAIGLEPLPLRKGFDPPIVGVIVKAFPK